ncbi:MAG: helix-turn-helix transcriptional regulator [Azospira sp.]|jgi:DNA-binding XRE family transcriptional regulator|nr:helix-turn-helix transcriptional regulator [Azospira sp.]
MNARIEFQTINGPDGTPAFVVVPIAEFRRMAGGFLPGTLPNAVVNAMFDGGVSSARAWREHLRLTQGEVAARMGISQAAYAQMEAAKRPRKATLEKIAAALGLSVEQLAV